MCGKSQAVNRRIIREIKNIIANSSQPGQHNSLLFLVLALAVGVAHFTRFRAPEEENLAQSFIGIDPGWQRRSIGNLQCHKALPLRLEWRHIDDDSAARIS